MSRHYVFTSFQDATPVRGEHIRYLVYQRERCPETGKEHWQGYVEFDKPCRIKQAQELVACKGAHMESRKGSREQARAYCMKEESRLWGPYEIGEWISGQGHRSDVKEVADLVTQGASDHDIATAHPETFMKMSKGIRELRSALCLQRKWKPNVEVYWGDTGTGKSLLAHEQYPDAFVMTDENGWWDGYDNQEDVIIDDFRPHMWSVTFMLKLLDRYPMRVPIKGSSANFVARNIIITTNVEPRLWYEGNAAHIMRRIDFCENVL